MGEANEEVKRLKGQRKVLSDLLEMSLVVLSDLRITTDDTETRGRLSDLISWSEQAIKDTRTEEALLR